MGFSSFHFYLWGIFSRINWRYFLLIQGKFKKWGEGEQEGRRKKRKERKMGSLV